MKKIIASKNMTETITYGRRIKKNDSNGIFDTVYMTMLCGAPIGRIIHPTLAAIVCNPTVKIIKSILSTFFNAKMAKGTNIIRETSLVMNMELKKQVNTNNKTN